jgi:phosphonate transport system permease protein
MKKAFSIVMVLLLAITLLACGIGAPLIFAIRSRYWERAGIIVIVLIITVTIIDIISSSIRRKLV